MSAGVIVRASAWLALLVLAVGVAGPAAAQPDFPRLSGRVVDQASVLRPSTERAITEQLRAHEAETRNQVVVVTLRSLQGYSIENFGNRLGRHWGIGQEGRDNGVLLIVAPNQRKVRIEVGYGLEGALTDALARTIIEAEILPSFRRGNLERGVRAGTDAILAAIAGTYEAPVRSRGSRNWQSIVFPILVFGLLAFVVIMIFRDAARDGRPGSGRTHSSGGYRSSGSSGSGGWSGGGGGFSGGGFSGGGGGFGGGGSSGSW